VCDSSLPQRVGQGATLVGEPIHGADVEREVRNWAPSRQ
jgi:hypothetical protein